MLCATLCAANPAKAGYWNYGCKGKLDDTTAVLFDRNTFLIMPRTSPKAISPALSKTEIFGFDADDNNSGFEKTMKFARGAFPDQKVVLTEKSSKKISEQTGNVGSREKSTVISRKIYHYQRLGWTGGKLEADIAMDCIEYSLSAP